MTASPSADAPFPFAQDVRAVLFDAGNTLLWIDHARIAAILGSHGVAADVGAVRSAEMRARPAIDAFLVSAPRRESRASVDRSVGLLLDELGASPSAAARTAIGDDLLRAWPTLWVVPPADARPVLDDLAGRGFILGVVSNSNGMVADLLRDAHLADRFATIVDSGIEGIEKPDARLFLRAAERLRVAPQECAYIGDLFAVDVQGARLAGMHGVLLDPVGAWAAVAGCDAPRVASLTEFASRLRRRA